MKGEHAAPAQHDRHTHPDTHSAILQRVKSASVTVDQQVISSVGRGILVFAAIGKEDTEKDVDSMAAKVLKARLWPDESKANSSVRHVEHFICVSTSHTLAVEIECAGYTRGDSMRYVAIFLPRRKVRSDGVQSLNSPSTDR